jgi:hypothetical protein
VILSSLNIKTPPLKRDNSGFDPEKEFQRIANIPYQEDMDSIIPKHPNKLFEDNYGDCDDKAVAFLEYLYQNGEKDIRIVIIEHPDGYSHAFALWNNQVYDPTSKPPQYGVDVNPYYELLKNKGFCTQITRQYKGYDYHWARVQLSAV